MSSYLELCLPGPSGIRRQQKPDADTFLQGHGWLEQDVSRELDQRLLEEAQDAEDHCPLLCLRCRVSSVIAKKLQILHQKHREQHELELQDMAACVLDDAGERVLRRRERAEDGSVVDHRDPFTWAKIQALPGREIRPFTAEILRSYDPSRCGLPTWSETRVQGQNELKQYLRSCGLLLISPWALLADTTKTRIKDAWKQCGEGGMNLEQAQALHASYLEAYWPAKAAYKKETGKSSGWVPDAAFLRSLNPPLVEDLPLRQLDQAIRRYLALRPRAFQDGEEAAVVDPTSLEQVADEHDQQSSSDLQGQILQVLESAALPRIQDALEADRRKWSRDPSRELAWQLYGEGISQREIASRCDHKQAWVSKLLEEKKLSHAIALDAATDLIRRPAFQALAMDPDGAERLVDALRNHLVSPEQEGDVAPLRRWTRTYLLKP